MDRAGGVWGMLICRNYVRGTYVCMYIYICRGWTRYWQGGGGLGGLERQARARRGMRVGGLGEALWGGE